MHIIFVYFEQRKIVANASDQSRVAIEILIKFSNYSQNHHTVVHHSTHLKFLGLKIEMLWVKLVERFDSDSV